MFIFSVSVVRSLYANVAHLDFINKLIIDLIFKLNIFFTSCPISWYLRISHRCLATLLLSRHPEKNVGTNPNTYTAKSPNLKTRKIILFQDSKSCFRIYNLGSIARKLSRQDFDNLENKIQNLENKIQNLENKI